MKPQNKHLLIIMALISLSCKKFLEIDPPKDSLVQSTVFISDEVAVSALTGIYSSMANNGFASGNASGITSICGRSADEFTNYNMNYSEFYENRISTSNTALANLYGSSYSVIYVANAVLEGLAKSQGITPAVKTQLEGEALFIRAFCYFYLTNLFGAVPLNLSTDYRINQIAYRSPTELVYLQIIQDLTTAERLLDEDYPSNERIRPNKAAANALLARTYLYQKDWENAEKHASLVIGKTNLYSLSPLESVFLKNSREAIWQLMPPASNFNTLEGTMFILTSTPQNLSLSQNLMDQAFEANDKRKTLWTKNYSDNSGTYNYPFKYKIRQSTNVSEYSMVFRLAEQYLIRAEARAQLNKPNLAVDDLDVIRNRAEISLIRNSTSNFGLSELLLSIEKERRSELFAEWGHRWLDLKRTGRSTAVLSQHKTDWHPNDALYPIPDAEINRNNNITQNEGY